MQRVRLSNLPKDGSIFCKPWLFANLKNLNCCHNWFKSWPELACELTELICYFQPKRKQ